MVSTLGVGKDFPEELFMALVHVEDVALAHILLYENTSAAGRHLCVESLSRFNDFAQQMERLYPEYKLPRWVTWIKILYRIEFTVTYNSSPTLL